MSYIWLNIWRACVQIPEALEWTGKSPIKINLPDKSGIVESGQLVQKREPRVKSLTALVNIIYPEVKEESMVS